MIRLLKIMRNFFFIMIPSLFIALLLAEILVRLTWDNKQGVPGLVLLHPTRVEVLAPNYRGYFAGEPLSVNNLGFRDDKDYDLSKKKDSFRIIMIGDSVTFCHGCKFKETWPYLFKKKLEDWNNEVKWEVWNLGVPGYDTVLELRTLEELGPRFKPDLVILGIAQNDIIAWDYHSKQVQSAWVFQFKAFLKSHFYLYTKLRYIYNVVKNLRVGDMTQSEYEQRLLYKSDKDTPRFDFSTFKLKHNLPDAPLPPRTNRIYHCSDSVANGLSSTKEAIAKFEEYQAKGVYNIVFFINYAPAQDTKNDRFVDGINNEFNNFLIDLFSGRIPVLSSYDAFWCYKPSEVPGAEGHSFAAANMVKADILLRFLIKNNILSEEKISKYKNNSREKQ